MGRLEDHETLRLGERENHSHVLSVSRSHGLAAFTVPASRIFPNHSEPFRTLNAFASGGVGF